MQEQQKGLFPKDPDTVLRMFTDQDYFLKKYEMCGATNIELLECSHEGSTFTIKARRDVPSDVPLPGFAKKFMSDTMTVIQRDTWDTENKTGRLDIEIKGVPTEITCDMHLVDEGGGAALLLDFEVKAHVPLIGKKLERLVLDDILEKFKDDTAAGVKLLENY